MNISELVDELYEAFAERSGRAARRARARFAARAAAGSRAALPWSRVFLHEVTLGAPALFAEAMPGVPSSMVRDAVLAHLLAVIDAFGIDRIEDEQSARLAGAPRRPRMRATRPRPRHEPPLRWTRALPRCDFASSDVAAAKAIRRERMLIRSARPVDLETYERESLESNAPGLPASLAAAHVAGWDERRCGVVRTTLESVWLGLQIYDDVVDWEDDIQRGGSWVVCLMKGEHARQPLSDRPTERPYSRAQVLQSGVLSRHARAGRARTWGSRSVRPSRIGAAQLASWAGARARGLETLCAAETGSAGYAVRAHALAAWAGEVLA